MPKAARPTSRKTFASSDRGNRYKAGKQRTAAILTAAKHVLVDGGYSQLTLRRVAAQAGIPLRHLQYYFRTKNDLLRALCEAICDDYIARCDALSVRVHTNPEARFCACIKFLINDNRNAFSNALFFELWALACHDEHTNRLVDRLYAHYRSYIRDLIGDMRPRVSRQVVESRAVQIVAFIEGLTLFIGQNKPHHVAMRGVVSDAARNVLKIALAK